MTTPELSGVDLARVALRAAMEAAKNRPTDAPGGRSSSRRRRGRAVRNDGREPVAFGAAISALMAERAWEEPVAGGGVIDQWSTNAPELAGHVTAVRLDPDTGTLELLPDSPAYATQVRLMKIELLRRIEVCFGPAAVRTIQNLPPGARSRHRSAAPDVQAEVPAATAPKPGRESHLDPPLEYVQARERARAALAATADDQQHQVSPGTSMSAPALREPEEQFLQAREAVNRLSSSRATGDSRASALRKARAERAQRQVSTDHRPRD